MRHLFFGFIFLILFYSANSQCPLAFNGNAAQYVEVPTDLRTRYGNHRAMATVWGGYQMRDSLGWFYVFDTASVVNDDGFNYIVPGWGYPPCELTKGRWVRMNPAVPVRRTLSVNGLAQDLTADRMWTVGDVTSSSLSSILGNYSTVAATTVGLSLKENVISAGTTSQYLRGDKTWQSLYTGTTGQYIRGDGSLSTFPSIPATQVNSDWNAVSGVAQILNKPTIPTNTNQLTNGAGFITGNQTITLSGDVTGTGTTSITTNLANSGVAAGTYGSRITVDAKGRVTSALNSSFNSSPARSLSTTGSNNTFTVSATRDAYVSYTVNFSVALIAALSNGQVDLDYSLDNGVNWTPVSSVSQVFGVSITITTNQNMQLAGWIPAGALVRINRSQNTNVTTTLVANKQQERLD